MRLALLIFIISLFSATCFSQETEVKGFVVNKQTQQRLAKVYIYNERADNGIHNNGKGEFSIRVQLGDVLYAALEGYGVDTVVYNGQSAVYFQLRPLVIHIQQVDIRSIMRSPSEQYLKTKKEYKYATDRGSTKDVFSLGTGGVGLSIDAIYNLLSKQGKQARYLQRILELDYHESIIDYRFKPEMVAQMLKITDPELTDFMQQYRPTYTFVLSASDYTFTLFIKNSYAAYKRAPEAFRLPLLPKVNP